MPHRVLAVEQAVPQSISSYRFHGGPEDVLEMAGRHVETESSTSKQSQDVIPSKEAEAPY